MERLLKTLFSPQKSCWQVFWFVYFVVLFLQCRLLKWFERRPYFSCDYLAVQVYAL